MMYLIVAMLALGQVPDSPRQKYSEKWQHNAGQRLYFKTFLYRANPNDVGYHSQTVVFCPEVTRDWVFWFNPDTGRYWGRCPTGYHPEYGAQVGKGDVFWSVLPPEHQRGDLHSIAFKNFTPVIPRIDSPTLPGSFDHVKIQVLPLGKSHLPEK